MLSLFSLGKLPSFQQMDRLVSIDVSYNNLSGKLCNKTIVAVPLVHLLSMCMQGTFRRLLSTHSTLNRFFWMITIFQVCLILSFQIGDLAFVYFPSFIFLLFFSGTVPDSLMKLVSRQQSSAEETDNSMKPSDPVNKDSDVPAETHRNLFKKRNYSVSTDSSHHYCENIDIRLYGNSQLYGKSRFCDWFLQSMIYLFIGLIKINSNDLLRIKPKESSVLLWKHYTAQQMDAFGRDRKIGESSSN